MTAWKLTRQKVTPQSVALPIETAVLHLPDSLQTPSIPNMVSADLLGDAANYPASDWAELPAFKKEK